MLSPVEPCAAVLSLCDDEDAVIEKAIGILSRRMARSRIDLGSPAAAKTYLALKLAQLEREVFAVLWLDARNRLIAYEELFKGTLTQTCVYPREVVRAALGHNAAAAIIAHNHPSGQPNPSAADRMLTSTIKDALALVDVRVIDHIIVAGLETYSFAEHGAI